jgi:ribosomal-protein-alanine N-acetyltransferase
MVMKAAEPIPVKIEFLTSKDLEDVCDIERRSFSSPWSLSIFQHYLINAPSFRGVVARGTEGPYRGRILGFLLFMAMEEEYHIINLATHPNYRRRKIGLRLMEHVLKEAVRNDVKRTTLEVRISNRKAISFYSSLGLEPVAIIPNYSRDNGEDALVMWRN